MHFRCVCLNWLALILLVFAAGCGPSTATVSGNVTVDGQPLQDGDIIFSGAEGKADSAAAAIRNGQYKVITTPGKKNVKISAQVVIEKVMDTPGDPKSTYQEKRKEILPDRYHSKSTLTIELKAGANTKDWTLESDKPAS